MNPRRLIYVAFFSLAFICLSVGAVSQKEVNESCAADSECRSGYCVTVKSGERKCSACEQYKLDRLTSAVQDKCKDFDSGIFGYDNLVREFGSKNNVSLVVLNYRAKYVKECLDARSERENTCWNGGDRTHKDEIEKLIKTLRYLQGLIDEKTRNNLAYTCEPDRFEDLQEDIDDNCKEVDSLFEKYGRDDSKEVSCSEINSLIDELIDCREALEDMVEDCFRNGAPEERVKRLNAVREMERKAKEKKEKVCR
ncbi:MAG TPA: hypothetical protein VFS10_11790 [Pyrinomonadaceae bacterium]|nr:hypothetical protein [Pyrinomonadaceae bacterium]